MTSCRDLINAIGARRLSAEIGVGYNTIQGWRFRDSIPVVYWDAVVKAAGRHGIAITSDALKTMLVERKSRRAA